MTAPERPDDVDERLEYLADHLDYPMAERLLQLLDASSSIHELVELRKRLQRQDDLVAEFRRQFTGMERARDRARTNEHRRLEQLLRAELVAEESRLRTSAGDDPHRVPMLSNWLGGMQAAIDVLAKSAPVATSQ